MQIVPLLPLLLAAASTLAAPFYSESRAKANLSARAVQPGQEDFPIHESCDASQRMQLERGLFDMKRLCRTAADHILEFGNQSSLFTTYFGEGADPAVPLGIFERLLRVSGRLSIRS